MFVGNKSPPEHLKQATLHQHERNKTHADRGGEGEVAGRRSDAAGAGGGGAAAGAAAGGQERADGGVRHVPGGRRPAHAVRVRSAGLADWGMHQHGAVGCRACAHLRLYLIR